MIEEQNIPQVSMHSMNEVHLEEVVLINRLFEALESDRGFERVSENLELLLEHIQEHFSGEEKMMKEAQYPSLNMHKAEHDKVLSQARYAEMEWRNRKDKESLREFLEDDIVTWLDQHIKAMDMPMADFIVS